MKARFREGKKLSSRSSLLTSRSFHPYSESSSAEEVSGNPKRYCRATLVLMISVVLIVPGSTQVSQTGKLADLITVLIRIQTDRRLYIAGQPTLCCE